MIATQRVAWSPDRRLLALGYAPSERASGRDKTYYDAGMRFGFIPSEGGAHFAQALAEVELAEELGFHSMWLEEHHSVPDHYWPSPIVALAAIASRTGTIRLGTDVVVASFYHPVRLAEDVAVLEAISSNRFTLGIGIGYRPSEFELYDTPLDHRGARFEELIAILRGLWRGERVDHDGSHVTVHGSIQPTPAIQPPIWIGGWGPRTIERAARLADAWVPGPTAELSRLTALRADYDRALAAAGRASDTVARPLTRDLVIAATDGEAWRLAEAHLLRAYRDEYGTWSHPIIAADGARVEGLENLARERFIIGSPETCVAEIKRFKAALNLDELIVRLSFPGMPHQRILDQLRLLATDVVPAFA